MIMVCTVLSFMGQVQKLFWLHLLILMDSVTNHFTLVRLYHRHKATPEFQRRISYVIDSNGKTVQFTVMQYMFENGIDIPVITPSW